MSRNNHLYTLCALLKYNKNQIKDQFIFSLKQLGKVGPWTEGVVPDDYKAKAK